MVRGIHWLRPTNVRCREGPRIPLLSRDSRAVNMWRSSFWDTESTIASRHRRALVLIIGAIIYGRDQLELRGKALSEA
jgi:hypothetical protein